MTDLGNIWIRQPCNNSIFRFRIRKLEYTGDSSVIKYADSIERPSSSAPIARKGDCDRLMQG